jgi:AhpD family alkylhydroperoxidase
MKSNLEFLRSTPKRRLKYEEALPDMMNAYSNLRDEVYKDGALTEKAKRLIAIGISLRAGCDPCTLHQTKAALDAGATRDEIMEAVSVAVSMCGSTALGWSWPIVKLLDDLGEWE